MVLILDGNSMVIDERVRSNLCYLICLRHLIRSREVTNPIIFRKIRIFHHTCAICSELPSNVRTMVKRLDRMAISVCVGLINIAHIVKFKVQGTDSLQYISIPYHLLISGYNHLLKCLL